MSQVINLLHQWTLNIITHHIVCMIKRDSLASSDLKSTRLQKHENQSNQCVFLTIFFHNYSFSWRTWNLINNMHRSWKCLGHFQKVRKKSQYKTFSNSIIHLQKTCFDCVKCHIAYDTPRNFKYQRRHYRILTPSKKFSSNFQSKFFASWISLSTMINHHYIHPHFTRIFINEKNNI